MKRRKILHINTPFFFCSLFDFIFWALLSISRAVSLCLKPLNTKKRGLKVAQKNKQRQMWMQTSHNVMTYHSSMISSDVLETELASEVGDSLLKSEADLLLIILSIPSVCLVTYNTKTNIRRFSRVSKAKKMMYSPTNITFYC